MDALRSGLAAERLADPPGRGVLVRIAGEAPPDPVLRAQLASVPCVVIGVASAGGAATAATGWEPMVDVMVAEGDPSIDDIVTTVTTHPIASTALALLLRGHAHRTLEEGLVAESAVYSTLQAGPEFAAWRASRPVRRRGDGGAPRVRCERHGDRLQITLTRPAARNAFDAAMRDALCDGLHVAAADRSIARVDLSGEGAAFCAGGDLDEFGSRADPATAHLLRLQRSAARAIAAISDRTVVHLHGPCVGSGIELAAFAGKTLAAADTRIALPEISLGLIPGAGGTVSLPARIGRHRTAWLALSGLTVDATTALAWGLADATEP